MMCLVSTISYLFDAYPPTGTLSALTTAACVRILTAAAIPLCIIQMIVGLGGGWAYSIFGIIGAVLSVLPFLLYHWGPSLRLNSKYAGQNTMGVSLGGSQMQSVEEVGLMDQ
jgi:MFS transporter, DHA1 family, multidrug resistance protein